MPQVRTPSSIKRSGADNMHNVLQFSMLLHSPDPRQPVAFLETSEMERPCIAAGDSPRYRMTGPATISSTMVCRFLVTRQSGKLD